MNKLLVLVLAIVSLAWSASSATVKRIFREPRYSRGNTNILKVQPIDRAKWIWGHAGNAEKIARFESEFFKFRRAFAVKPGAETFTIDVSADERFYLTLDGEFVARGPNRAVVENWQYQTYEITLPAGEHVFEATVWRTLKHAPLAQFTFEGGFILKASEPYDEVLTTGIADWQVGELEPLVPLGDRNDTYGTGDAWRCNGTGLYASEPRKWRSATLMRSFAGRDGPDIYGGRTRGWMLFPSQLKDQIERETRPGAIKAVSYDFKGSHVFTEEETKLDEVKKLNALLKEGKSFTWPAHTKVIVIWDLGDYHCAYPVLTVSGGKGTKIAWSWCESTREAKTGMKGCEPHSRDAIVGRTFGAIGDVFMCDGREKAVFSTPWFRCGKWCKLCFETGDEPLAIKDIKIIESRYPLEDEAQFVSEDDPSLQAIRRISRRAMQMCSHEMLFDCPYYEQQMYAGDTRVQLNVISALTGDDRLIRRAIELYDLSKRDDGMVPFNWPTRSTQEGATYTLCYLLMYGDYVMNHADRDWLKARLPGFRNTISGLEYYENAEGLLENLPGWQFMDWVPEWRYQGEAPGGRYGEGVNAEANLFWLLAMRTGALVERALGNETAARYWEEKIERLKVKLIEKFWCEDKSLFADTPERDTFSEHAQCLALLGDALPADKARACFERLVNEPNLARTTVYFSYYLFDCYFKFGRGDLFLKRLDLWREYVKKGLTTTQEAPDGGKNGQEESRSDCHAWGAHPIWFMQTGLAGIKSDAPFFERVKVEPCPGGLKSFTVKHPHPQGFIEANLAFEHGVASGIVRTPVPGVFVYGQQRQELKVGENKIEPPKTDETLAANFAAERGRIRPNLHSSGWAPQSYPRVYLNWDKEIKAMNLAYSRTHDWALVNLGQRVIDYQYVFPLFNADAAKAENYVFAPTDRAIELACEKTGLKIMYRLGTSIEHTGSKHFNALAPTDFDQTAEIFAGIVRHYTTGWADGVKGMAKDWYWEIWNEPDNGDCCWDMSSRGGAKDDEAKRAAFIEMFVKCLKRIKTEFPEAKVGGPGMANRLDESYFRPLLKVCKDAGVAPDFISWHYYGDDPDEIIGTPAAARRLCDEFGFTKTELVINEYHYIRDWNGIFGSTVDTTPEMVERTYRGPHGHNGIDAAAFYLTLLMRFHETPLDQAYWYGSGMQGDWGIADANRRFNKPYFAARMFGEIVRDYPVICDLRRVNGVTILAVKSADGRRQALLVADYRSSLSRLDIDIRGISAAAKASAVVLDDQRDLKPCAVVYDSGKLSIDKNDNFSSAFLVKFEEDK